MPNRVIAGITRTVFRFYKHAFGSMLHVDRPTYKVRGQVCKLVPAETHIHLFHFCLPPQSHMLNSLLVKEFFTKIYTACTDTPSNNCNSSYLIRVGPGHRQSASDSRESSRLQRGAGWHYSSDRRVRTTPLQIEREGVEWAREEKSGRSLFELSVCGDEEWEGGKVNMGHSSGLRHVLLSGWKRKWLGPITDFFFFFLLFVYNWSHSWRDVPFWLAFSSAQCLLLWLWFLQRSLAKEKAWSVSLLTFSPCIVPVIQDASHANLIYIIQLRKNDEAVSHIVGLSAWFAFQLHLVKSLFSICKSHLWTDAHTKIN